MNMRSGTAPLERLRHRNTAKGQFRGRVSLRNWSSIYFGLIYCLIRILKELGCSELSKNNQICIFAHLGRGPTRAPPRRRSKDDNKRLWAIFICQLHVYSTGLECTCIAKKILFLSSPFYLPFFVICNYCFQCQVFIQY